MNQSLEDLFHYTDSGLDNVYLASGVNHFESDDEYGGGYSINNLDGLHKVLVLFVANKGAALTPKEIRFLRIEMDLSQKELAHKLDNTDQTISLWERGKVPIPWAESLVLRSMAVGRAWGQSLNLEQLVDELHTKDFDQELWDHLVMRWKPIEPEGDDGDDDEHAHWFDPMNEARG